MPNPLPASSWPKTLSQSTQKPVKHPNLELTQALSHLGYQRIIGIDEVGRGALAGPLVVAAVELNVEICGIKDSKQINKTSRRTIAEQIHKEGRQISFGQVSAHEIDNLGLASAQRLAYDRALDGIEYDLILTDNVSLLGKKFCRAVKGDQLFYPTAAASIVAKVYRDQLMTIYGQFYPEFNWSNNAGYGTKDHLIALIAHGQTQLHRNSFIHH